MCYLTWKLELVSHTLWMVVVSILYYPLKLSIIHIMCPLTKCEIFLFHKGIAEKILLFGDTLVVQTRSNRFFVIPWEWFVILSSNVTASIFTSKGSNKKKISTWALPIYFYHLTILTVLKVVIKPKQLYQVI